MIDIDSIEAVTAAVMAASRVLVAISARSLSAVEDTVTLPQFRLLTIISVHGPMKLVTLAERLDVNPSTAMRMVDRLVSAELVTRGTNPRNRREVLVSLTESGHHTVAEVTARRRREIADIVRRMEPQQRAALVAALEAFASAGGERAVPARDQDMLRLGWS
jgi:DNA-binding MarR family transcriptional regulator